MEEKEVVEEGEEDDGARYTQDLEKAWGVKRELSTLKKNEQEKPW